MKKLLPFYHQALLKHITAFVLAPFALFIFLFIYNNYQDHLEQAQKAINEYGKSTQLKVFNDIQSVRYSAARVATLKAVAESPVNILYSQNALFALQGYVERTPLVSAAFVSDDAGFIIEGYPIDTLRVRSSTLTKIGKKLMQKSFTDSLPELVWLDKEDINDFALLEDENRNYLLAVVPLFAETNSIVEPFEPSGSLSVIFDYQQLIAHEQNESNTFGEHLVKLRNAARVLATSAEKTFSNTLTSSDIVPLPVTHNSNVFNIEITTEHDRKVYTDAFWSVRIMELSPILLLIPLMIFVIRRFTNRLSKPIDSTAEMCKQLASGNYQVEKPKAQYQEFEELYQRIQKMAETIEVQIDSLEKAKLRAEQSEQIKGQFLANMSHEIRTPMNGVLGMLQLLEDEALTEKQQKKVDTAKKSASNLLTIINDILDISKIEANKIEMESINCDVLEIIDIAIASLRYLTEKQGNNIQLNVAPAFPSRWNTDPTRFSQIFTNILSNAVKFTQNGKITIMVSNQGQNKINVAITDTGIGISKYKLNTLFDAFQQADISTTRQYGGTGLGLSICKNLCELMGGEMKVSSTEGKGSTFVFSIMADSADLDVENDGEPEEIVSATPMSSKRILVAEDNEINREVIGAMLSQDGMQLVFAENGEKACEMAKTLQPDLILMDVHMPILDGIQATKMIRQFDSKTPILMQTANVMKNDVEEYLKIGAQGYIAKPFVKEALVRTVKDWLQPGNKSPV